MRISRYEGVSCVVGLIAVVLSCISLAQPWYFASINTEGTYQGSDGRNYSVTYYYRYTYTWNAISTHTRLDYGNGTVIKESSSSTFDELNNDIGMQKENKTFDLIHVCFILVAIGFVFLWVKFIIEVVSCMLSLLNNPLKGRAVNITRFSLLTLGIISIAFCIAGYMYYINFSKSLRENDSECIEGPCKKFFGSDSKKSDIFGLLKTNWGPFVGWWLVFPVVVLQIVSIVLSLFHYKYSIKYGENEGVFKWI